MPFRPKDFRTTMATRLSELGVSEVTIGRMLGHAEKGVTRSRYVKHRHDEEKQAAWERWSTHVRTILGQPA